MSRNFELLQRLGRERRPSSLGTLGGILSVPVVPAASAASHRSTAVAPADAKPVGISDQVAAELVNLVQRVFYPPETRPHLVVFSPVEDHTAASGLCAATSEMLARQLGLPTCIVDADVSSPTLHRYFDVPQGPGLLEALDSDAPIRDFSHRRSDLPLSVITTGKVESDDMSRVCSSAMLERMTELRREFECVLIVAPSLNKFAVASALARPSDGVVMVISAHSTLREVARKAKQDLEAAEIPLIGAVLNNRTYPIPDALYAR